MPSAAPGSSTCRYQSPWLRDQLLALFGVERVCVPRHGYRPLPVDVVFTPVKGGGRPANDKDELAATLAAFRGAMLRSEGQLPRA